jgi:hypothetical protein
MRPSFPFFELRGDDNFLNCRLSAKSASMTLARFRMPQDIWQREQTIQLVMGDNEGLAIFDKNLWNKREIDIIVR